MTMKDDLASIQHRGMMGDCRASRVTAPLGEAQAPTGLGPDGRVSPIAERVEEALQDAFHAGWVAYREDRNYYKARDRHVTAAVAALAKEDWAA